MRFTKYTLFVLFILLCYLPSFWGNWQYDDYPGIVENTAVISKGLPSISDFGLMRLLPNYSFAINHYFSGLNPLYFHLANLLIHLISTLAIFLLIKELYTASNRNLENRTPKLQFVFIAGLTAILWSISPIQTQAVSFIVQRIASMAGMFYFLALLFYLKYRDPFLKSKSRYLYFTYFILFTLAAFLSKENALMLIFMIIFCEWLIIKSITKANIKSILTYLAIGMVIFSGICITSFFYSNDGIDINALLTNNYANREFTPFDRLLSEPRIIVYYMSQMLFPFVSRFHLLYDFDWLNAPFQIWTYCSILLLAALLILTFKARLKQPLFSFAILFMLINHLPESSIVGLHLIFEHRNYIPSLGFFLLLAMFFNYALTHFNKKYTILIIIVFIVFNGINTFMVNQKYQEEYHNALFDYRIEYKAASNDAALRAVDKTTWQLNNYQLANQINSIEYFMIKHNQKRNKLVQMYDGYSTRLITYFYLTDILAYQHIDRTLTLLTSDIDKSKIYMHPDLRYIMLYSYSVNQLLKYKQISNDPYIDNLFGNRAQKILFSRDNKDSLKVNIIHNINKLLTLKNLQSTDSLNLQMYLKELSTFINMKDSLHVKKN